MFTTTAIELNEITCPSCAGVFAISAEYQNEARRLGGFKKCWTCPYCKTERGFGEGEADKLRAQLADKDKAIAQREVWLKWERESRDSALKEAKHFRKSRDGMKGVLGKTRKRIANGVCPCCNRHFANDKLPIHIASKHPDFAHIET